jgi:hypothetical protein
MSPPPGATLFAPGDLAFRGAEGDLAPEGLVVELPLLLPGWQVEALEAAARREGRTLAEMARRLIRDFLHHPRR